MKHKLWAYKLKSDGRLLAFMDDYKWSGLTVGAVIPGTDGNYYKEIIIGSNNANSAKEYLEFISGEYVKKSNEEDFTFSWDDVEIVEFEI